MRDLNKERKILSQLYANEASVVKYLPFFFSNEIDLKKFFDMFAGKTIKMPKSYEQFLDNYLKTDCFISNVNNKGINNLQRNKEKILNSYTNLFNSLEELIENECKGEK